MVEVFGFEPVEVPVVVPVVVLGVVVVPVEDTPVVPLAVPVAPAEPLPFTPVVSVAPSPVVLPLFVVPGVLDIVPAGEVLLEGDVLLLGVVPAVEPVLIVLEGVVPAPVIPTELPVVPLVMPTALLEVPGAAVPPVVCVLWLAGPTVFVVEVVGVMLVLLFCPPSVAELPEPLILPVAVEFEV